MLVSGLIASDARNVPQNASAVENYFERLRKWLGRNEIAAHKVILNGFYLSGSPSAFAIKTSGCGLALRADKSAQTTETSCCQILGNRRFRDIHTPHIPSHSFPKKSVCLGSRSENFTSPSGTKDP